MVNLSQSVLIMIALFFTLSNDLIDLQVSSSVGRMNVDNTISGNINSVHQFTEIDDSLAQSDRVMSDEESLRRAVYYDRQARSMRKTYELDEALRYYKKSVTIKLNTLGENHPDVADSYNNIGNVYRGKGELDKALEYYNKSLTIKLNTLGENHPDVAASYNNIGIVYRNKGELDRALEYYNKSLTIRLNTLAKNHPNVAASFNDIGNVYVHKSELDKALEYYNKSLTIKLNTLQSNAGNKTWRACLRRK